MDILPMITIIGAVVTRFIGKPVGITVIGVIS